MKIVRLLIINNSVTKKHFITELVAAFTIFSVWIIETIRNVECTMVEQLDLNYCTKKGFLPERTLIIYSVMQS